MNPEKAMGAKIPDQLTFPSCAIQLETGGTLPVGTTNGDSVAVFFQPTIGDGSSLYPIVLGNGIAIGSIGTETFQDWPDSASVRANFGQWRCVSAALEVYFIGPSTADQGTMYSGCTVSASYPSLISTLATLPEMTESAARDGARVVWKPLDVANMEYISTGTSATQLANANIVVPFCTVGITGLTTSTAYYRYHVTANFECIPKTDTYSLLSPSPSPYNEGVMKKAIEWVSSIGNNVNQIVSGIGPYVSAAERAYSAISAYRNIGQYSNTAYPLLRGIPGYGSGQRSGPLIQGGRGSVRSAAADLLTAKAAKATAVAQDNTTLKQEIDMLRDQIAELQILIRSQVGSTSSIYRTSSGSASSLTSLGKEKV